MAETPLLAYVADIERQLVAGAADEASFHSRHILSKYPKYNAAYRLLGRALLLKGQLDEAEAAFRRVLSVEPADRTAHLGLAELFDQRHRGDEAIWHAERALEQDVQFQPASDLLIALFRRYHNEQPRLGLTAVTLARQALHNRDYAQAVSTLRGALDRQPERIDQRLLLAEVLWASGDHIGAAETATEVLDTLPDCMAANTLLAQLWLEVGRPSDARPYLNRLESLDPYLAVQVVTGAAVDADAFTIEPLDYRRSAQNAVTQLEPDWLQRLPADEVVSESVAQETDWSSGMLAAAEGTPESPVRKAPEVPADAPTLAVPIVAASVVGVAALADALPPAPPEAAEVPAFELYPEPEWDIFSTPLDAVPASKETVIFTADPLAEESMPDLGAVLGMEAVTVSTDRLASPFDESEVMPEVAEAAPVIATGPLTPFDPFAPEVLPPAEDALAWLRESGVELIEDEPPEMEFDGETFAPSGLEGQNDPMAWLNAYDSAPASEAEPEPVEPAAVADESAWESDAWNPEAVDVTAFTGALPPAEDPLLAAAGTTAVLRGLTARLGDADLTPSAEPAPDVEAHLDEWLAQFETPSEAAQAIATGPGWLNELGAGMTNEPELTPESPEGDAALEPLAQSADDAAWLNEFSPENLRSDLDDVVAATGSDWLASATATPDQSGMAEDAGLPDWLAEAAPDATAAVAGAMLGNQPELEAIPGVEEFDWLTTLNQPSDAVPEVDEAVLAAQADVPDWLDALESQALAQIDANQSGEELSLPGELDAIESPVAEFAEPVEPIPFDDTPAPVEEPAEEPNAETEWLTAGPPLAVAAVTAVAVSNADTLSADDTGLDAFFASLDSPESAVPEEPPTESEPVASAEADEAASESFELEPAFGEPEGAEAEPSELDIAFSEADVAAEAADVVAAEFVAEEWGEPESADLSRIAPATVATEMAAADALTANEQVLSAPSDWFTDSELTEAPEAVELADLGPAGTTDWYMDADLIAEPAEATALEWQSELEVESEPSMVTEEFLLDQAEVSEPEEADAAAVAALAASEGEMPYDNALLIGAGAATLGVLAVASADEGETAPSEAAAFDELDEDDDWLAAEWPEDAEAPVLEMDELDELPDIELADETAAAPAQNAPDWLNAMVPGLDVDFEAGEDAPIETAFAESSGALDATLGARSEYAWVIELVDQEERETAPAPAVEAASEQDEARFVFHRLPAWYRREPVNGAGDDDFADWSGEEPPEQAWQS